MLKSFAKYIHNNIFGIIGFSLITFGLHGIFGQFLPVNRALFIIVIGIINIYNQLERIVELDNDEVMDIWWSKS